MIPGASNDGLEAVELPRLRQLEDDNARVKAVVGGKPVFGNLMKMERWALVVKEPQNVSTRAKIRSRPTRASKGKSVDCGRRRAKPQMLLFLLDKLLF